MANVDPFDVFGDSDDDEDDGGDEGAIDNQSSWNSRQVLVAAVNERLANPEQQHSDVKARTDDEERQDDFIARQEDDRISDLKTLVIPCWSPPLYLGPIQLVTSLAVGGGRGYVATQTLEPGTLVMVEAPLIGWPTEQIGNPLDLVSIQHILESPIAEAIVQMMELLHPTKAAVDQPNDNETNPVQIEDMMDILRNEYRNDPRVDELIEYCEREQIRNRDGTAVSERDFLRMLLALRCNGLESGIYCHMSMLNHDCFPNCVKFFPDGSSSSSSQAYSEARTTRKVFAGESLSISYISRVLCHASRRRYLWEQHRFDIGVDYLNKPSNKKHRRMELVGNRLPPSRLDSTLGASIRETGDETSTTRRIENATEQLETLYQESMQAAELDKAAVSKDDGLWEQIKALELSSLELCREAQIQLQNDQHILLLPCFRLHLDTCELVQHAPSLSTTQRLSVLVRQVQTAQRLIDLQKDVVGKDHFDLARTYLDLANAIHEVLSKNPKLLFQLVGEQRQQPLTTFAAWSALENRSRKEYERIRALYPHDAEERIIHAQK